MRRRRDANRDRLKRGLKSVGKPAPIQFRSQGSYAMRTMVQQPDKDYDIDDGVVFPIESLRGPRAAAMTPGTAKTMVRDALDDQRFSKAPESRTNCVRIYYQAGYHVDMPVYRCVPSQGHSGALAGRYELASTDWKPSDPHAVTLWFHKANKRRSPDLSNGGQMRRIVRLLKAFARSRSWWRDRIASGFMISALVVECYQAHPNRDDRALYETVRRIHDRLCHNLEILHPVIRGTTLTTGPDDAKTRFLRAKLEWALQQLEDLLRFSCTREQALGAWDRMFKVGFFSARPGREGRREDQAGLAALTTAPTLGKRSTDRPSMPVDYRGDRRYA